MSNPFYYTATPRKLKGEIKYMNSKSVKFNTKLIQDNKVYLPLSDVTKALGHKRADFISKYSSLIEKISGVSCIRETDYNTLLSENETALHKQGQIEVTRIETLRSKIDCVLSFQGLKFALARDYLQVMAARTGCKSIEEYILVHEIPQEKRKALKELMQDGKANSNYLKMIEYLRTFDIDKLHSFGLDMQYLVSIDCMGRVDIDAYMIGVGVFCKVTDLGDYASWEELHIDGDGNVILPYYNCDAKNPEDREKMINLSEPVVEHDFREGNVIENMLWCIENLNVDALEDYEFDVFGLYDDVIDFSMGIELLVKIIKPDAISTIYTDRVIDIETGSYMTEFDSEKVFMTDFR